MKILELLHGSNVIVEKPQAKLGKVNNDYGQGFYCTLDLELASEWATFRSGGSFVSKYRIDAQNLKILDLTDEQYSILHWITILLENRRFDLNIPIMLYGKDYLLANYHLDLKKFDVIMGYRADDSYFSFARDFLSNALPIEGLEEAIKLGNLGIQYFIRSDKAFDMLEYRGSKEINRAYYAEKRKERDDMARKDYKEIQEKYALSGTFLRDIIKERL